MSSNAESRMASECAKEVVTKVAEMAFGLGMKKAGHKARKYVTDKIFTKQAKEAKPLEHIITGKLKNI